MEPRPPTPHPHSRPQQRGVAPPPQQPQPHKLGPSRFLLKNVPSSITWDQTVPFVPPVTYARVIKVYDGDTITVASVLPYKGSRVYRFQVRLNGIDTPEMKTSDEAEKAIALQAKEALKNLIYGKWVKLQNTDNDKYGRLLADVWCEGLNVNQWMLDQRYAVRYDGGTKHVPADWEVFHRTGRQEAECLFVDDY